jgi:hypothetical protein
VFTAFVFFAGLFVGANIGLLVACLLIVGRSD